MSYNANRNYAQEIKDAISNGASSSEVSRLQSERNEKIAANKDHYSAIGVSANDDHGQSANDYISSNDLANSYLSANSGRSGGSSVQYGGGGPGYQAYQGTTFQDYLDQSGYDAYQKQMQDYVRAMVDKAVNGYQSQIGTANQDSDKLAKQAYVAKMLGEKNLDQKLSASGYAGGMADSQRIQSESNYQNNLNDIETQRATTVKQIQQAISDARLTGDMQTAQALSQQLSSLQSQWSSYVQQQESMNNADYWNQKQMDNSNYWNQQNRNWNQQQMDNDNYWKQQDLDAQKKQVARAAAMESLSAGIMPDSETLAAAGMSQTEAAAYRSVFLNGRGAMTGTATARKITGSSGYDNAALTAAQVKYLQSRLGVTADGMWGDGSAKAANGMTAEQAWNTYAGTAGMPNYNKIAYEVAMNRSDAGKIQVLKRYYSAGALSDAQVTALAKKYGIQIN